MHKRNNVAETSPILGPARPHWAALDGQTGTRARLAGEVEGRTAAGRRAKGWVRDRLDAKAMHGPCWWERAGQ